MTKARFQCGLDRLRGHREVSKQRAKTNGRHLTGSVSNRESGVAKSIVISHAFTPLPGATTATTAVTVHKTSGCRPVREEGPLIHGLARGSGVAAVSDPPLFAQEHRQSYRRAPRTAAPCRDTGRSSHGSVPVAPAGTHVRPPALEAHCSRLARRPVGSSANWFRQRAARPLGRGFPARHG